MPNNPYDEIPYTTLPRQVTHPDRLATVGNLFGMNAAPVARCRVLELGCGDASNLIPMAYALPESHFTGVDLADVPIAAAQVAARDLGLGNLKLRAMDLREISEEFGEFDYIFAHGVYSWVPVDVRDRLIAVCRERLSPQGIAFISYNAYPGRHLRQMLREMLFHHTRHTQDNGERVQQARWFLRFLREKRSASSGWHVLLDRELDALLERPEGSLLHDDLGDINDPVYFRDFVAHAARHGLQYLGEADVHEMFDRGDELGWVGDDVLKREQYRDFLRARSFRQTLLCRQEVSLQRKPGPELMDRFWFSAPAKFLEGGQIEGLRRIRITAVQESVTRVASALGDTYPLPASFDDLLPYAGDREALREIVYGMIVGGYADLHVFDFPCEETVTERPRASRLARYQAARSAYVASACHHVVKLDDVGRNLVCLMDGTRDHEQLARDLAATEGAPDGDQIRQELMSSLQWLARMALLEG